MPWTTIYLIDFYVIHNGDYDIESILYVDGEGYGHFNPQVLIAYAVDWLATRDTAYRRRQDSARAAVVR